MVDITKKGNGEPDYKPGALLCLIVVIASLLVASLTYRFIKVPARNYLDKAFETKGR